jgi:hypothetical protein
MKISRDSLVSTFLLCLIVVAISSIIWMIMSAKAEVNASYDERLNWAEKHNCKWVGYSQKDQKLYTCDDGHTYLWWDLPRLKTKNGP